MSETLVIGGVTYNNVAGFKATDDQSATQTYIKPSGSLSISANDTYDVTQYASAVVNVSGGETRESVAVKDVNFYDYDGIRLYSYTAQEFNALESMPANPSHDGLTAQGWNYTLAEAKTCLTSYGGCEIGQLYVTDDGKTRIYIDLEEQYKTPRMQLRVSGSVTVDWGDNSTPDTFTATNYAVAYADHAYSSGGKYMITITAAAGNSFKIDGERNYSQYSHLFMDSEFLLSGDVYGSPTSIPYAYAVRKIEIGSGCVGCVAAAFKELQELETITFPTSFDSYELWNTFEFCCSLKGVVLPKPSSAVEIKGNAFSDCQDIVAISFPPNITANKPSGSFQRCHCIESLIIPGTWEWGNSQILVQAWRLRQVNDANAGTIMAGASGLFHLERIVIPSTVTSFSNSAMENCGCLKGSVTIPSGVTSMGTKVFYECKRITEYHLLPTTPPTLSNTNAFYGINPNCVIYVPVGSLSAYQSASNWSTYASYMQEEPT